MPWKAIFRGRSAIMTGALFRARSTFRSSLITSPCGSRATSTSATDIRKTPAFQETDRTSTHARSDRKSVVEGKSVSVRVDLGGRRNIKKTKEYKAHAAHGGTT